MIVVTLEEGLDAERRIDDGGDRVTKEDAQRALAIQTEGRRSPTSSATSTLAGEVMTGCPLWFGLSANVLEGMSSSCWTCTWWSSDTDARHGRRIAAVALRV